LTSSWSRGDEPAKGSAPDWITGTIAVITLALLLRFKKVPGPYVVAAAGILGILLH
jgi:chromate transporter